MSYDMPFYETGNQNLKGQMIMDQAGADADTVAALIQDWKEENLDLDNLIRPNGANSLTSQSSPYTADHQPQVVPTFNSAANNPQQRPNALDLTRQVKFEPRSCQEMESHQMRASSASPHGSPYSRPASCNGGAGSVFNYSTGMMPHSPAGHPAASPYSPHGQVSPVSPHMQPAAMSPHSSRSNSCSPVPYMSAVFGRYADASLESYMSGYADIHGQFKRTDKNSESYRAKRERNNIAVRRSREKKKQREIENELKVQELSDENNHLQSRLDVVLKEMKLLKSLYTNIGVSLPPEAKNKIDKELAKLTH